MFSFDWEYRPGVGNPADALSRLPTHGQESTAAVIPTCARARAHKSEGCTSAGNAVSATSPTSDPLSAGPICTGDMLGQCRLAYDMDPWFRILLIEVDTKKRLSLMMVCGDLHNTFDMHSTHDYLRAVRLEVDHDVSRAGQFGTISVYHFD